MTSAPVLSQQKSGRTQRRVSVATVTAGWLPEVMPAVLLAGFALVDLWLDLDNSTHYGSLTATVAVVLVATLALCWRRRHPLGTVVAVAAAVAGPELFTPLTITLWGHFVPLVIATWAVARWGDRRTAAAGAAVVTGAVLVIMVRVPSIGTVANIPFSVVPLTLAFVAGRVIRHRAAHDEALTARTAELERIDAAREAQLAAAVEQERNAIARELHDIVAHCVSVMVVQAGAAEDLLDRDPERAREPLRAVQDTGQQAVAELSRMLGLLRGGAGDRGPDLDPLPDTGRLPALVDRVAGLGLPVTLTVVGDGRPGPPGVELTAYRIVQEALTNTLRHAGPGVRASVRLAYEPRDLVIEVVDDGRGASPDGAAAGPVGGHGLVGMRERVAVCGGTLEVGHGSSGGFRVSARLPLDEP